MHASSIGVSTLAEPILPSARGTSNSETDVSRIRSGGSRPDQRRRFGILGVLLLVSTLMAATAIAAPSTYTGEAPVANQSEGARAGALKTALAEVVIRLSGDPGILARSEVAKAVAGAEKLVLQYRYRRDNVTDEVSGTPTSKLVLAGDFNRWLDLVVADNVLQVNSASPPVQGIDATLALSR